MVVDKDLNRAGCWDIDAVSEDYVQTLGGA